MALVDFSLGDVGNLFTSIREAVTGKKLLDPNEQAQTLLQLQQLEQALAQGQIEINKVEAASPNWFVAGWRPGIGWVAALSLFLMYVPKAIVLTVVWTIQCYDLLHNNIMATIPAFPDLGAMDIIGLVGSLLGIAGMRSVEKIMGKQDNH